MDYHLMTTDKEAMVAALVAAGVAAYIPEHDEEVAPPPEQWALPIDGETKLVTTQGAPVVQRIPEQWIPAHGFALRLCGGDGRLFRPTGVIVTNADGDPIPQYEQIPGFHANLRGILTPEQAALLPLIEVNNPMEVWA